MNLPIVYRGEKGIVIDPVAKRGWMVKTPVAANARNGNCSLDYGEFHNRLPNTNGILYIDKTKWRYVFLPIRVLNQSPYQTKDYMSVSESLFLFNTFEIAEKHQLEWVKIPIVEGT